MAVTLQLEDGEGADPSAICGAGGEKRSPWGESVRVMEEKARVYTAVAASDFDGDCRKELRTAMRVVRMLTAAVAWRRRRHLLAVVQARAGAGISSSDAAAAPLPSPAAAATTEVGATPGARAEAAATAGSPASGGTRASPAPVLGAASSAFSASGTSSGAKRHCGQQGAGKGKS